MKLLMRVLVVGAALTMVSACGKESPPPTFQSSLQGTWSTCLMGTLNSGKLSLAFGGSTATVAVNSYTNLTCAGVGTSAGTTAYTYVIGPTVTASLGAASVTAHQIDLTSGGVTQYDLVYIDGAVTPHRLYVGDSSGLNDGSTAALRPTTLDNILFLTRE
jgi:hypothetical protein